MVAHSEKKVLRLEATSHSSRAKRGAQEKAHLVMLLLCKQEVPSSDPYNL